MDKEKNIKEKFKQVLISTVKVISEDFEVKNNNKKHKFKKWRIFLN